MKKLVIFSGAGISQESGLPTFRGEGGIWEDIDAEKVADWKAWYCGRRSDCRERRQAVLDFFNPIRRRILECEPNEAHRIIASLEEKYEVTVITQNGDDYHERAGSTNVIHLHGVEGSCRSIRSTGMGVLDFDRDKEAGLRALAEQSRKAEVFVTGQTRLLGQPEYQDLTKAQEVLGALDEETISNLPARLDPNSPMQILVGPENVSRELKDTSVVVTRFDIGDGMQGMIGVVGPQRMDYAQITARLSYFAESLGRMFSKPELPEAKKEE